MQDRYAFDTGDFSKLGLLRRLAGVHDGGPRLRLGLFWYACDLVPEGNDGRHLGYLELARPAPSLSAERRFRICEPEVYDGFRHALRRSPTRSIARLERSRLFPEDTVFVRDLVPRRDRAAWFERGAARIRGCELVCCDPDNGLAEEDRASPKHILWSEVRALHDAGSSLVVYHHLNRLSPHPAQIRAGLGRLAGISRAQPFALRYRRGSSRAYFVLPQPEHANLLRRRAEELVAGPFGALGHFELSGNLGRA